MKVDLTGRTAIVTGSTAGIGRATAEGFARAGATAVVNGRTQARVAQAVREITKAVPGARVFGIVCLLGAGVRHHRRGAARGWRRGANDRVMAMPVAERLVRDFFRRVWALLAHGRRQARGVLGRA